MAESARLARMLVGVGAREKIITFLSTAHLWQHPEERWATVRLYMRLEDAAAAPCTNRDAAARLLSTFSYLTD